MTAAYTTIPSAPLGMMEFDVTPIVNEVVGREGWGEGNALAFVSDAAGSTQYASFASFGETDPAAQLVIEYTVEQTQEERLVELAQTMGLDVKRLDGRVDALENNSGGGAQAGSIFKPLLSPMSSTVLITCPWGNPSTGSTPTGVTTYPRAQAITIDGLEVTNLSFHLASAPATGAQLEIGVYDVDEYGFPAALITQTKRVNPTQGANTIPLAIAAGKKTLWVAHTTSVSMQIGILAPNGLSPLGVNSWLPNGPFMQLRGANPLDGDRNMPSNFGGITKLSDGAPIFGLTCRKLSF